MWLPSCIGEITVCGSVEMDIARWIFLRRNAGQRFAAATLALTTKVDSWELIGDMVAKASRGSSHGGVFDGLAACMAEPPIKAWWLKHDVASLSAAGVGLRGLDVPTGGSGDGQREAVSTYLGSVCAMRNVTL
jgi:hypothetical protein